MRTIVYAKSLCVLICCTAAFFSDCKKKYNVARENMAFEKVIYQKTPPKECIQDSSKSKVATSVCRCKRFRHC